MREFLSHSDYLRAWDTLRMMFHRRKRDKQKERDDRVIDELVRQVIRGPEDADPALTLHDLCDVGCHQRAAVRVKLLSGKFLDFCRHDYLKHEAALAAQGATISGVTPGSIEGSDR